LEEEFQFGAFSIVPARRSLMREGSAVPLGSRAVDILLFLLNHPAELKTNAEIIRQVWPDTFVDEANLRVHVSALRKALGDIKREPQFIANVPGRGYTFIAPVNRRSNGTAPAAVPQKFRIDRLPARIFGRDQTISALTSQLAKGRLVTIAGPGGIGKSTIARAVVASGNFQGEIVWIDLSEVETGHLIPVVIASALGILSRSDDISKEIAAHLQPRKVLLVLDSCEHVVADIAGLAEDLLAEAPDLRILATSREPLRAEGERVHRLLPLDLPASAVTAEAALTSPAVQLFVERADACLGGYELTDADAADVVDICTRLDGIALAIELAAGRLEAMGISALSRSLSDCFRVLTRGRRTALPRHQTLRATLDWSFLILAEEEQQALRELSVFRGRFSTAAAGAVLSGAEPEDLLAALVAKSLVVVDTASGQTRYRLLDTTRLYACEKLAASGDLPAVMARFSACLSAALESAEQDLYSAAPQDWPDDFAQQVPGLRAALDWAFAPSGDALLGVRLTVSALPLFFRLSLLDECLAALTHAIAFLDARPGLDEKSRMKLYAALGWPQLRATNAPEHGVRAWTTAWRIAEALDDVDHQLRAIWALWVDVLNRAEPRQGLELAERFALLAPSSSDPTDAIIGKRMKAATLHWLGRHAEARRELTAMLADYEHVRQASHSVRFQFDQRVTARIIIARCLWILGDQKAALAEVEETMRYASGIGHNHSISNLLAEAVCPLAIVSGNDAEAAVAIRLLRDHTKALSLDVWHTYADCFEAELHLRGGEYRLCLVKLQPAMDILDRAGFNLFRTYFQSIEAQALSGLGQHEEAHAVIDDALSHCDASGERWCLPELLRVKALVTGKGQGPEALDAASAILEAARLAARQDGAAGWERRINVDLEALGHEPVQLSGAAD
jgi:predicted ATPase/DNA-binding winged helix-turn-helix (wHTH) protein